MTPDASLALFMNSLVGQPFLDGIIVFFASTLAYILIAAFLIFMVISACPMVKKLEILFATFISALIARLGVTELIRFFYHRPRPFDDLPVNELFTPTSSSFPSGHATFFFALGTVVYLYDKRWGSVFLIFSALMVFARVVAGVHYLSDVLAGALIGALVAYGVTTLVRKMLSRHIDK